MKELLGKLISIEIFEPFDWKKGNLIGQIIDVSGNELLIQMFRKIKGENLKSNLIIVSSRYLDTTFELLLKRKPIIVNCALTNEAKKKDFICSGSAKIV